MIGARTLKKRNDAATEPSPTGEHYLRVSSVNIIRTRVATVQGKQGIWMLTFPDRENTGNLVNLILTQGKL